MDILTKMLVAVFAFGLVLAFVGFNAKNPKIAPVGYGIIGGTALFAFFHIVVHLIP